MVLCRRSLTFDRFFFFFFRHLHHTRVKFAPSPSFRKSFSFLPPCSRMTAEFRSDKLIGLAVICFGGAFPYSVHTRNPSVLRKLEFRLQNAGNKLRSLILLFGFFLLFYQKCCSRIPNTCLILHLGTAVSRKGDVSRLHKS